MGGRSLFKQTEHGGWKSRRSRAPGPSPASAQLAHLSRLERDLERACGRYERAIAALDARSEDLEHSPPAEDIVRAAKEDLESRTAGPSVTDKPVSLSSATFEDLRALGLSVTQSRRVLRLRHSGALPSTAELDSVPGLPRKQLVALKLQLSD